jgi:hypothetical protein
VSDVAAAGGGQARQDGDCGVAGRYRQPGERGDAVEERRCRRWLGGGGAVDGVLDREPGERATTCRRRRRGCELGCRWVRSLAASGTASRRWCRPTSAPSRRTTWWPASSSTQRWPRPGRRSWILPALFPRDRARPGETGPLAVIRGLGGDLGRMARSGPRFRQRPRRDSNPRTRLRRPMLYPLSYEGRREQGSADQPHRRTRCLVVIQPVPAATGSGRQPGDRYDRSTRLSHETPGGP